MRVDRFVLDNNIWISYFITERHHQLIEIVNLYDISIFSCDELINEFIEGTADIIDFWASG
jgi:predicted nucleic acid-binding protein